ncbi:MAG: nitrite reductase large subunit [Actinomycetota bacterium]
MVAGHGMVGQKLLELLVARGALDEWRILVIGEEPRTAYDRVHLSSLFDGASADDLSMVAAGFFDDPHISFRTDARVVAVDRARRIVTTDDGREHLYDELVLATGSVPFVPPVGGADLDGCFVYRTIDDLVAIGDFAAGCRRGAVVGGGLLGLEAANALRSLSLETTVVEFAPRLMPAQVDDAGGDVLRRHIESLGVAVRTEFGTSHVVRGDRGQIVGLAAADGESVATDLVVFSAGIRPRDDLARSAGLAIGARGGVVVDDRCHTEDDHIWAIGECAHIAGRTWGLVGPGYQMARVVADQLLGDGSERFAGGDLSTKLKLLGVEVASFGDAFGATPGSETIAFTDRVGGVHRRVVVDGDGAIVGGILVGDASGYDALAAMARRDLPTPVSVASLVSPAGAGPPTAGAGSLPDTAVVCSCNNVTAGDLGAAVADGAHDVPALKTCTSAGTGCGGCLPMVDELLRTELAAAGIAMDDRLCEHFPLSRQELFDLVRMHGITTFAELLTRAGTGRGCEICKPAVASMLASLGGEHILRGEQASLQDTNDHFLANLQRDGTYSIVPRVPGGEITPAQLIAIGEVARDFRLYTKITGAQRIDMFGAQVHQLPAIWARLVDAGMESGHAYGKALRTVKSCVGSTWCRYGVQDSVGMAIDLELRYRGLRAPHKIKMAVSGCTRECAEAQSKDVGVIATENGWNVYVAGNGGARPQHGALFATDLTDDELLRTIDRYLMFYVRTAGRLERTATWFNKLGDTHEASLDHLRRVIVDDVLGICDELDAEMARHVADYRCEWKEAIESPEVLARFKTFVNTEEPDPSIVFVRQRGQIRPARAEEKAGRR